MLTSSGTLASDSSLGDNIYVSKHPVLFHKVRVLYRLQTSAGVAVLGRDLTDEDSQRRCDSHF